MKRFYISQDEEKSCDQYFFSTETANYYLIEQKVRDDHDSSKKQGQFKNFQDKIVFLKSVHGSALIGAMYFIDPALKKNRNYYQSQLQVLSHDLNIPLYLFYDGELFDFLGIPDVWSFIQIALAKWQRSVPVNIELDYDTDPEESWKAIQNVDIGVWYKLLMTDALWEGHLMQVLFSNGTVLRFLLQALKQRGTNTFKVGRHKVTAVDLASLLEMRLLNAYGSSSE